MERKTFLNYEIQSKVVYKLVLLRSLHSVYYDNSSVIETLKKAAEYKTGISKYFLSLAVIHEKQECD